MSDYRQEGTGKVITENEIREVAESSGYTFEEYLVEAKLTLITEEIEEIKDPGNTTGSAAGVNALPNNQTTPIGTVLDLDDTSSELSKTDPKYYVTAEELSKGSEEDIAPFLNKKLSRLGITVEQATALGSLDAVSLSRVDKADPELGVLVDLLSAIKVGKNQSKEDLAKSAELINRYIEKNGDSNYVSQNASKESSTYENYVEQITAPDLTRDELNASIKADRLKKFQEEDARTATMTFKEYRASGLMKPEDAGLYHGGGIKRIKKPSVAEDFSSAEEFKAYKDWRKNGFVGDVADFEISLYDNERKKQYALDKSSEYVSGLNPSDRTAILALASEDEEKISNFKDNAATLFKTRDELEVAITNYDTTKSKENYLQAFELQSSYLKQQNELQIAQATLEASGVADREKAVPYAIDDFNRNYDRLEQLSSATKSMGTDVAYSIAQLALLRDPYALAKMSSGVKLSTQIEQNFGLVSLGGDMQKEMENFQRAITVDNIGSISDAGRWVAGSLPNLLPSLGMAMTGPAAMPLFFLSGAGGSGMGMAIKQKDAAERMANNNKLLADNPEMDQLERASIETQMGKDAELLNIPDWKILSNQAIAGIAEVAFEKIGTMRLLKGLKDGIKILPPQTVKEGFEFVGKTLVNGFRVEGGSEFATTLVTNFGDIHILGEDKSYFEGGLESLAQGTLMGGGIAAAMAFKGVKQAIVSELANKAEVDELFSITNKLRELTKLKIEGPSDPALANLNLPTEAQQTVDDLITQGQALEDGVLFKVGADLSPEALKAVGEVNRKIRKINKRLIDAYANPNIKASQLAGIEKVLRGEFNKLAGEREQILTNETDMEAARKNAAVQGVSLDSSTGYELYRGKMLAESTQYVVNNFVNLSPEAKQAEVDDAIKLLKENKKEGAKEPTAKEINDRALSNYIDKTYKARIQKGQTNAQKFADDIGLNVEFVVAETKEDIIAFFEKNDPGKLDKPAQSGGTTTLKEAINNGSYEGGAISGSNQIVINMESSIKNRRTGIFAHEVLHKYARENFGKNQDNINAAGESLLSYLQKNQPDLYAKVKFRIDESYTNKNIEGELVKEKDYYEEAMNAMSDVLADGQKVTESTVDRIKFFANKFLPAKAQLQTGDSAYRFVKDYNKASHFGGKTVQDPIVKTAVNNEDDKLTKDSLSITKFNQQLEQLENEYDDGEIDFDVYEQQKANIEGKLARAQKEATVISKDPEKEIEVFHGGAVKTVNDIDGAVYFSESKEQAEEYAKGNNGKVQSFKINESEIATEAEVFEVIRELNIQPTVKGWTVDDSRLYELIDARFDNAFSKEDLSKLNEALAERGIKATRFTDTDLRSGRDTENIVLFDKSAINQKAKPVAKSKPKPTRKSNQELKEVTAKSKKELDDIGNNPDGFNKDNPKIYTILRGFIKSKSLVFKTKKGNIVNLNSLPGFNVDNMVSETIANMLPYIAKFDPKQNDSLFGYLMAQLNNRMKGALNTGKVTDSQFDEDVSEAKGVVADTSYDSENVVVAESKYKNLIQQKVLSVDGLKAVKEKVISTVRVLKTRIDAVISKNASVTPIIAEIRKEIGKQADITFKKEMGGIKNNEIQDYLKANKKAILENMTTTYLLTFMPEGVQKSVGGKYMLNAKGEKVETSFGDNVFIPKFVNSDVWKSSDNIDREKTSTGSKGKTSGADIQRRVPNIAQEISDEFFISKIIGPDGKPIPGRKNSIAKAMGEEIGFDMISQDLQTNGPITQALKANQEALGVLITEQFEDILDQQMERGDVKYSLTKKQLLNAVDILDNNKYDQFSPAFNEWKENPEHEDAAKIWEENFERLFIKTDGAVRTQYTKNAKEMINKFPYFKEGIEAYGKGFLNNDSAPLAAIAEKQLAGFWEGISKLVDPAISKVKGLNFLGATFRTPNPKAKVLANIKRKSKVSPEAQKALDLLMPVLDNVTVYSGSSSAMNAVREFMTASSADASFLLNEFNNSEIGDKTRLAKEANILLFNYLNILAKEVVASQPNKEAANKSFAGYLRWLETNNNNDAGLKGLAHVIGLEILPNQAPYIDSEGRGYYSIKSKMVVVKGEPEAGQLKINKNHTNFNEARTFIKETNKTKKPAKRKELENLSQFKKDQNTASSLQIMGEHQQSMGQTGIELAEAVAENVIALEKGTSKKVADNIFNLRLNKIANGFGIVLNSRFISEKQDKIFGKTSTLGKSRVAAVKQKISDNIFALNGELISKQGKNEVNNIVNQIIKAEELAEANKANQKAKDDSSSFQSLSLTKDFNNMIERNKGVAADVNFSKIVAKRMGANIGKYKFYLPSSAEDFRLLTSYTFAGKGKDGTQDMAWFEKNLIRPYTEGIAAIDVAKQTTKNDFKALNKAMPDIAKNMGKLIPTKDYTNDQAVRVYLWDKAGYAVPGLNKQEVDTLVAYVAGNPELAIYANALVTISKSNEWLKPSEHWDVGTILSDINNLTEKGGRKAYLAQWIENVDEIFSDTNLNKIEALYGKRHREALEDSLYRMKNGTNRPSGSNGQVNRWNNWLNNSIGAIMFFNRRSALLQTLSTSNFLNWSDNNPIKAAAAFANQKQYWADFSTLFNSAKLKQRRGGLRADVNEAEIANAAANSKNKAVAALSWLLKKGFTPTQIADSFAISSGGATFYRNRINTYLKAKDAEGNSIYTEKQAEDKAFLDFIETSDQSQQSSDPSLVSMEQASILGRLVLAFQNTTQQYSRIMKRSALDIIKRRQVPGTTSMLQSDFSNFSKIVYYGAIQNVIFNSLSAALFALIPGFGEEEDDELLDLSKADKLRRITNGSVDSLLKGMGVRGAVIAQIKNTIMEYFKQKDKGFKGDQAYTVLQVANLSPPIGSKLKKIYSALTGEKYGRKLMEERGFDLTANGRLNLSPTYAVLGSLAAGAANIPLDRMYAEIQSVSEMLDERNTIYQRLALSLGFRSWDVNAKNEEDDLIKAQLSDKKKSEKKEETKLNRRIATDRKLLNREKVYKSLTQEQKDYILSLGKNARKKALDRLAEQLEE